MRERSCMHFDAHINRCNVGLRFAVAVPEWRIAQQEELQHLEMTAGFSESLRPLMPRRSVRIKRPGKTGAKGTLRTAMKGLSIDELRPPVRVRTSGARDGTPLD